MADSNKPETAAATVSLAELKEHLNNLWTQYLTLLDQYDKARKELSSHLSSGFFSLAQANFKSPNRIRYGHDCYDDRMQASRSASITIDDDGHAQFLVSRPQSKAPKSADPGHVEAEQQPTPPGTPSAESLPAETSVDNYKSEKVEPEKSAKSEQISKDPIRWFGVLVPTQLRSCQGSFISAVEGPVCDATGAARAMRAVEVDIRRLRKDIKKMEKGAKEASALL